MTQKAKNFLKKKTRRSSRFVIDPKDGGIVGSLVGLGFITQEDFRYRITVKGQNWIEEKNTIKKRGA